MRLKKMIALLLAGVLALSLCACGTDGIYVHDTPETSAPEAETTPAPTPAEEEPATDMKALLGSPVVVSVSSKTESYRAPDDSGRVILTYGYDAAHVYLEDNAAAADRINQYLAVEDEIFYSGRGTGDGVNALLEQATDNYAYAMHEGKNVNLEFSCVRSVYVERGDSRVLTLRFRTNSYTGGEHGLYTDRAYVFDTAEGKLLTLDDLGPDRAALESKMLQKMEDAVHNDVRYQPLVGYVEQFLKLRMEDALQALFREGSWLLNEKGLVVFSDIYEIGSYADGIVRFTVPYEELDGLLYEQWLPVKHPAEGTLQLMELSALDGSSVHLLDKVTVSREGMEFCVYAEGTVYDLSVSSVSYFSDEVGFYQTGLHWYGSYLSDSGIQIQTDIPDGMPNLMLRYLDAEGQEHSFLISQSGRDGSLLLLEEQSAGAVG